MGLGRSERPPGARAPRTLGDLLYADGSKRVPEQEWTDLVRAIAGGDQQALYALYERSHRLVFTLTMRITNDHAAAEELTVDVFHDVWRRAAAYDPADGSVLGWIMNQARSRAIDRLRFDTRKKRVRPDVTTPPPAPAHDPHDVVDVRERRRALRDALHVLTPAERHAIESAFFGDMTYREVAERLDEPLGTVKTRVRSGLAKLRDALTATTKDR